jgi:hypothetical protein
MRCEPDGRDHLLRLIAVRYIFAGEELTINHRADGGAAVSEDDL